MARVSLTATVAWLAPESVASRSAIASSDATNRLVPAELRCRDPAPPDSVSTLAPDSEASSRSTPTGPVIWLAPSTTSCSAGPVTWDSKVAWLAPLAASRSSCPTVTSARSVALRTLMPGLIPRCSSFPETVASTRLVRLSSMVTIACAGLPVLRCTTNVAAAITEVIPDRSIVRLVSRPEPVAPPGPKYEQPVSSPRAAMIATARATQTVPRAHHCLGQAILRPPHGNGVGAQERCGQNRYQLPTPRATSFSEFICGCQHGDPFWRRSAERERVTWPSRGRG